MQDVSEETQATFFALRMPNSHLLLTNAFDATNASDVARDLRNIHMVLKGMTDPELHLTNHLIGYVQQGVYQVLKICNGFNSPHKRFDFVVEPWCHCLEFLLQLPDAYTAFVNSWPAARMLLDTLVRLVDGIPVANSIKDRMPDEARLAALRCLILLLPLDRYVPGIQDVDEQERPQQDWEKVVQFKDDRRIRTTWDEKTAGHLLEPGNQSVVGRLLVVFMETAADATLVNLRITALEGFMKLIRVLPTPDVLSTWLPGIMSGLTKVILARGLKDNHAVLTRTLDIWTYCVIYVLGTSSSSLATDGPVCSSTVTPTTGDLLMKMYKEKQSSGTESEKTTGRSAAGNYGTTSWFKAIIGALKKLFREIAFIRNHSHWKVRLGFGQLSFRILRECQGPIAKYGDEHSNGVAGFLLETLIGCSRDEYEEVYVLSNYYLGQLTEEFKTLGLSNIAKEIMREKLLALPRVLHGPDESRKQEAIKLALGLAVFLGPEMERMINHQNLWSYVQSWVNVLTIEQLDQHNVDGRGGILGVGAKDSAMATGATQTAEEERWNMWVKQAQSSSVRKFGFPRKIMLHLREQVTSSSFLEFLRQVGSTTEISTWSEEVVSRLQQDTRSVRENQGWFDSRSVSAVVLMNQLLLGASSIGLTSLADTQQLSTTSSKQGQFRKEGRSSSKKKHQRHVRKVARGILEEYLAMLMESSILAQDAKNRHDDASSKSATHRESEGPSRKSTLAQFLAIEEGEGFDFDAQENKIYDFNTDVMLKCVLLEGIASIAVILGGTEFEMELVRVLYVLLERLGDQDSALVRDTAQATLEHVAFVCQYQTIGDLIQANYDYVIQQVSQRIAFLSANPKTPQVLWSLIHVVGPPAVSMLEDSVTEIFEALDHWKSQDDEVAEGLLKALSEITKVMAIAATEMQSKESKPKRDSGVQMLAEIEISQSDAASTEVAEFAKGYRLLTQGIDLAGEDDQFKSDISNMTPEQIKEYFLQREKEIKEQEERRLGTQAQEFDGENEASLADDDDNISFGDLRAQMPRPTKESKPEPPTKHQALCLRILDKAGYFLTASSPRMRVLALEIIQSSIVVLKDRPQELNPAIFEMWPSIVRRILRRSEMEVFYVSLRAIEIVTLLAENCSDFLSRHLLNDVWPFILRALKAWTKAPPQAIKNHATRTLGNTTVYQNIKAIESKAGDNIQHRTAPPRQRRQATKVLTREHRLQLTTLESVSKIVRKIRIPVQELWEMLLLARDMVRDQYWTLHWDVRMAAMDAIKSMALAGHGDSVWLVVRETVEELDALYERQQARDKDVEDEAETKNIFADVLEFIEDSNL
ncbi:TEL2-interacting protein 1 [Podila verticillata]|nr:TEL2-interacting protein 1 [Podila verticillata]